MLPLYQKLAAIQSALKAPKSQYNEFGKYKYRKAEDILESVKPLLSENGCTLTCTDELVLIGDRYYIKATAILTDAESGATVATTAFAREEEEKKGMDGSQITGASSSYARKYALNGLLCIDDTADSDTTNQGDSKPTKAPKKATKATAPTPQAAPGQADDKADMMPGGRMYLEIVKAYATGRKTKKGGDYKTAWVQATNANPDMVDAFDHDVATYRLQNNIQPAF